MPRPIGIPKTGGRKKDTPNKSTQELQSLMEEAGVNPFLRLMETLPELKPSQQAKVCLDLMAYVYPKRKAVDMSLKEVMTCTKCESVEALTSDERRTRIKQLMKFSKETDDEF